jgi:aspartyl-tRNA synthetase
LPYQQALKEGKISPTEVIGEAFDLVCNGEEILSGGMRIHDSQLQEKVLELLGYDKVKRNKYFAYFLQALDFAAPPHGGVGLGIDRMLAQLIKVKNLKELLAFPKNIDGSCSLTGTPDSYDD